MHLPKDLMVVVIVVDIFLFVLIFNLFVQILNLCRVNLPSFTFAYPLNRRGHWGTTDGFTTSFLHFFFLFSTALWDLANSRPIHSLMLSLHIFFCLLCFLPPFTLPCKMVLARPDERGACPYHFSLCECVSVQWSGLHVVRLPAGSRHRLPRW